jgi:hypothetical protein
VARKDLEKGGKSDLELPDVEKDPMEDLSKKIMNELKTLFPDRKQPKNTGNVTPSVTQGTKPAGKIEGGSRDQKKKGAELGFKQASAEYS